MKNDNREKFKSYGMALANSITTTHPVGSLAWNYESGLLLFALWEIGKNFHESTYVDYVHRQIDTLVDEKGIIIGYKQDEYNLDQINAGRIALALYEEMKDPRYEIACRILAKQLELHPVTELGGYWHKKIYPYQIWLDGLYMYGPFAVRWGQISNNEKLVLSVCKNLLDIYKKAYDPHTGLLRHAWDEKKIQLWADPVTGQSPHVWGRAMGWYCMALVDVLSLVSPECALYPELREIAQDLLKNILRYQDKEKKLWYQVVDQGARDGNYLETSCSAMFIYYMVKGSKLAVFNEQDIVQIAEDAFIALSEQKLYKDKHGCIHLGGICKVAGLGGTPYRDGSFSYYINEPVVEDDFKGVGPYLLAATELYTVKF